MTVEEMKHLVSRVSFSAGLADAGMRVEFGPWDGGYAVAVSLTASNAVAEDTVEVTRHTPIGPRALAAMTEHAAAVLLYRAVDAAWRHEVVEGMLMDGRPLVEAHPPVYVPWL